MQTISTAISQGIIQGNLMKCQKGDEACLVCFKCFQLTCFQGYSVVFTEVSINKKQQKILSVVLARDLGTKGTLLSKQSEQ